MSDVTKRMAAAVVAMAGAIAVLLVAVQFGVSRTLAILLFVVVILGVAAKDAGLF